MNEIKEKLKTLYFDCLTKEEINRLDVMSETEIRSLVNHVWHLYLTDPFDYVKGEPFRFLVTFVSPILFAECDASELYNLKTDRVKVYTEQNINDAYLSDTGYICNINWQNTSEIYLPDDLVGTSKYLKADANPIAIYNVCMGEGRVSAEYDLAQMSGDALKLLFVPLNKRDYNPAFEPRKIDLENLARDLICEHLLREEQKMDLDKRDLYLKKYGKHIINRYLELVNMNAYNPDEFIKEIVSFLKKSENIIEPKL